MKQFATEYVSFKFGCLLCFKIQFKLKEKAWRRRVRFAHVHLHTDFFLISNTTVLWTGKPGMLWFMGLQKVGWDWETEMTDWLTDIQFRLGWIFECEI